MISKFTLLSNLLLASLALAAPSTLVRRENFNNNWAGVGWSTAPLTFTSITGTFAVPSPSSPDGSAYVWVGIDGNSCATASLQTGIEMALENGVTTYKAWNQWYPGTRNYFSDMTVNAGDHIRANITAYTTTHAIAIIDNLTSGQSVSQDLTSTSALCEQDIDWILEAPLDSTGANVPFTDFQQVIFTDSLAFSTSNDPFNPSGGMVMDIRVDGKILTQTTEDSDGTVVISYIA